MNEAYFPGPGDAITWGPCIGHAGDPRTEPADDDTDDSAELLAMAQDQARRDPYDLVWALQAVVLDQPPGAVDVQALLDSAPVMDQLDLRQLTALLANAPTRLLGQVRDAWVEKLLAHGTTRLSIALRTEDILKETSQ